MSWPAKFPGACASCDEPIVVGQRIDHTSDSDGRYEHEVCPAQRPVEQCDRCWQAKAANGSCGCPS